MDKFNGLKLTSFLMGVCLPLGVAVYMISAVLSSKPRIVQEPTQEQVKLAESFVSLFSVDYDAYGKYTIGDNRIVGEVVNNSSNVLDCNVWLEDVDGSVISDVVSLSPSSRSLVFISARSWETAGKYDVKLIYEVLAGDAKSRIECPYVVLVNGG